MSTTRKAWSAAACAAVAILVAVVMSGAFAAEAAAYRSVEELAEELRAAEISCERLEPRPQATLVQAHAACVSGVSTLDLYLFDGAVERDRWSGVAAQLGPVAVGPNWAVTGGARDTQQAAEALHGQVLGP